MKTMFSVANRYNILQLLYWMSYAPIYSFSTVFLLDRGFSDGEIGILIALSCTFSAIAQPYVAAIADRSKKISLRMLMILLCAITIVPMIFVVLPIQFIPWIAIWYTILLLLHLTYQPLLSALGMQLLNYGYELNFGIARGMGSVGFAILSVFLGTLTLQFSTICTVIIAAILYVVIIALLFTMPELRKQSHTIVSSNGTLAILKQHKKFALLCLGIVLIFISHSTINTYMFQILQRIGKGNTELGQILAFTAFLEFLVMVVFLKLVKGRDCGNILRFSSVFFVIKAALAAVANNLIFLYIAMSIQTLSFALFTPAVVYYANMVLNDGDKVKGQALITIAITVGTILGSFLGGQWIELWGVTISIWCTTVLTAFGMICFFVGAEHTGAISNQ